MTADDVHLYFTKLEKTVHPSLKKIKSNQSIQHFGNNNWWTLEEWQTTTQPCTIFYAFFKYKITLIS